VTSSNVDLALACVDAFARRDVDSLLTRLHPDVEVRWLRTDTAARIYRGHAGVRDWLGHAFEIARHWTPTPLGVRDLGGGAVLGGMVATPVADPGRGSRRFWAAATMHDGKVSWCGAFRTEEHALAAVASRQQLGG
jgi:ketosteroid isomerase-like protein